MGTVLFWVNRQLAVEIPCRSFGATYWHHLQGPRIHCGAIVQPLLQWESSKWKFLTRLVTSNIAIQLIAVCSQIHTKHINTLCGQNVELLNVKLAVHIVTTGL